MAPSPRRFTSLRKVKPLVPSVPLASVLAPKPAGVTKPIARAQVAKPAAKTTTTRPTTRAYAKKAGIALRDEKSEEPMESEPRSKQSISTRVADVPAVPAPPAFQPWQPIKDIFTRTVAARIVPAPPALKPSAVKASALQPSAIPAPSLPRNTETELENLMTIGREQVEKELKDRIREEKEKKRLLEKQKAAFNRYQAHMAGLQDLEDELRGLKEENRMDEDEVMKLADEFRAGTMIWARMFEEYAGNLGITLIDLQRLSDAWY
ncbi:hypothetical protein QBC45DRAFT_395697 [Copromyces sp. CBS 386.78]|nr:hypothetical protein QBC45DRAFT_395697 [Copromyces sp. CBS 386.78]